ncbi:hypothetical protein [Pseudonocardia sp. MH-G8]|uniref:hypothetical protein n=1 Tax=Pseudonocardia sp. MH-G8 TaxID=1854588 RepID=UPI0018E94CB6|nr:hypothetical protein [Pseudonocardia sp. MH-G8]
MKAKLFINHAMDNEPRSFEEQALWASLALELLGKAALARTSPVLIAEPNEEGVNLLMATGLVDADSRFISVRAATIYKRCGRAFKPFNSAEALRITAARNEYLHGGGIGFTGLPPEIWWARFWAQAAILVNACDSDIDDFVGSERVDLVEEHLARNQKNIEHRAEMLMERAKQRLAQYETGTLPARLAAEWSSPTTLQAYLAHHATAGCPACGSIGILEGDVVESSRLRHEQIAEDDFDTWAEISVSAEYFSCEHCKLVLDSYELLEAAGMEVTFESTGDAADFIEAEYGND